MKLLLLFVALLAPLANAQFGVIAPAASASISGTLYTLTPSSVPAKTCSVLWWVNGVWQGTAQAAPWSLDWNTNNTYNSNSAWHYVYAIAYDCTQSELGRTCGSIGTVCTQANSTAFQIYNAYLEPSSYISCGAITTGTPLNSSWAGTVNIRVSFTGSNASNSKNIYAEVDGDIRVYSVTSETSTTQTIKINTTMFPNGPHLISVLPRDAGGSAGTSNGYPFCQWEQEVTFNNSSGTSMELLVSPKEWVIAPTATEQLSPIVDNTDGTTQTATGVRYSSGNTAVCTVNSSGLVTGIAYGTCQINVTSTNGDGYSRTIYGYVASTNVVPHFGTDQRIHTTADPGVDLWFASEFQNNFNSGIIDPFKTVAQFAVPSQQAGFNVIESSPVLSWPISGIPETTFDANVNSTIAKFSSILSKYKFYFHGIITPYVPGCGGSGCGSGSSPLYSGTRGVCATYLTPCWQYMAQQWMANRLLGFSGPDEADPYALYPNFGTGVIGSPGAPTQITCVATAPTTWNVAWGAPGPDVTAGGFIIVGATTNSPLNTTTGGSIYQYSNFVAGKGFSFTGPSCARRNVTVNSSTDPGLTMQMFAFEWDNNSTDYVHNTDWATISTQIHAGGAVVTGPVKSSASASSQAGWLGNCTNPPTWGDYAEVYASQDAVAFIHPDHGWVSDLRSDLGIAEGHNLRTFWGNMCTPRALIMANAAGLALDYGLQGASAAISSIVGPLVTFSAPHHIYTVYNGVSRATISESSNPYFNRNVFINNCPTATTCNISLATPSSMPAPSPVGTLTFADGTTFTNAQLSAATSQPSCAGGGTCNVNSIGLKGGMTFTFTCTSDGCPGPSYYTSNTFVIGGYPVPNIPVAGSGGGNGYGPVQFHEVPPSSETSSSASALLYPDNYYHRGINHNAGEVLTGANYSAASVCYAGVLGASGIRYYNIGQDYTLNALAGNGYLIWGDTSNYTIQAGNSPTYPNGETTGVETFWAPANCNLELQRLATTGYLYNARYGCPDIGFNIECSLRKGSKGNLLLAINLQDGPQTRTVDLTNVAIAGQPTIRRMITNQQITISTIPAGVTSDTPTFPAAGMIDYLAANNAAAEVANLQLSMRLADVSGAATGGYLWSYTPQFTFGSPWAPQGQYTDCSSGSCTLPVDRNIGPVYAQAVYFNSSGLPISGGPRSAVLQF